MPNGMQTETWIGVVVLAISNVGIWIDKINAGRRLKRADAAKSNGMDDLKRSIKGVHDRIDEGNKSATEIAKNLAVAVNEISNMQNVCKDARANFKADIDDNKKRLINHIVEHE